MREAEVRVGQKVKVIQIQILELSQQTTSIRFEVGTSGDGGTNIIQTRKIARESKHLDFAVAMYESELNHEAKFNGGKEFSSSSNLEKCLERYQI